MKSLHEEVLAGAACNTSLKPIEEGIERRESRLGTPARIANLVH
jgi:hypothetical protein